MAFLVIAVMHVNHAHRKTRVCIEQRYHLLHSKVRMQPENGCQVVGACAVLHNIALVFSEPMEDEYNNEHHDVDQYHELENGQMIRNHFTIFPKLYFHVLSMLSG